MPKITESQDKFNITGLVLNSEPMWRHSTFLVGGSADFYAVPSDEEDLRRLFISSRRMELETFVLGGGSNILVSDSGIRGLVIDTRLFDDYRVEGKNLILGAGLAVSDAAWKAGTTGLAGLDFLFGMPGSVGGAIWMNARCYDAEISDSLIWVDTMDSGGQISRITMNRDDWSYKHSPFQNRELTIIRAAFGMRSGDPTQLRTAMMEKRDDRESKGHYKSPCAGSAFKNNRDFGSPSGALIDSCGLKGYRVGGAAVSPWHGNIFINDRSAAAGDIRKLISEVGQRVEESTGFRMEPEILMVGEWNNG